jgi:hypothetical protein
MRKVPRDGCGIVFESSSGTASVGSRWETPGPARIAASRQAIASQEGPLSRVLDRLDGSGRDVIIPGALRKESQRVVVDDLSDER